MTTHSEEFKILIGDNSEILNNMLRDMFEENGFDVLQAFEGSECKGLFLRNHPDVALIDARIGKVDGLDVLAFIKQRSPRTIVVVMTGVGSEYLAIQAIKLGADDCIQKPFSSSEVVSLVARLLDARKDSEENFRLRNQLQRRDRYLAQLTTIINEALVTTDPKGRIQFMNRAAVKLWGYSSQELNDKDIHFLIRGEASDLLYRDLVKDTIRYGKIEGEFNFRTKDRRVFPGYLSTSVIRENKVLRGIVLVVSDMTRLYDAERRLRQSERLASLGKVVQGVAHEVRNCVTSLGGFALRLSKLRGEDPVVSQYIQVILSDTARLEKMVKTIEEYVRFSKRHTFKFVETNLPELIEKSRDRVLQNIAIQQKISVSFSLNVEKRLPSVQADPTALEEAFYNLILNAYEAMPDGGKLKINLRKIDSAVSITFVDTGIGIRRDDIGDIFNPFVSAKTSGAGMGLSKVHLLIEEHGGTINVDSKPSRGSTFEVLLPMEHRLKGAFSLSGYKGVIP
jgi:PAS domain S-box-containing protein